MALPSWLQAGGAPNYMSRLAGVPDHFLSPDMQQMLAPLRAQQALATAGALNGSSPIPQPVTPTRPGWVQPNTGRSGLQPLRRPTQARSQPQARAQPTTTAQLAAMNAARGTVPQPYSTASTANRNRDIQIQRQQQQAAQAAAVRQGWQNHDPLASPQGNAAPIAPRANPNPGMSFSQVFGSQPSFGLGGPGGLPGQPIDSRIAAALANRQPYDNPMLNQPRYQVPMGGGSLGSQPLNSGTGGHHNWGPGTGAMRGIGAPGSNMPPSPTPTVPGGFHVPQTLANPGGGPQTSIGQLTRRVQRRNASYAQRPRGLSR